MTESRIKEVSRRDFLANAASLGGAGLLGLPLRARAEPPPEVTKIRLVQNEAICLAPQYLAEEFLRLEGFAEVEYAPRRDEDSDPNVLVAAGRADFTMDGATSLVPALDQGRPFAVLAGVHGGCYELFGNERIRAIRDLKGKTVAIWGLGAADHIYIASMMAYVGIDPRYDVKWSQRAHSTAQGNFSSTAKATRSSDSPLSRSECVHKRWGTSSSTRRRTGLGRSISVA